MPPKSIQMMSIIVCVLFWRLMLKLWSVFPSHAWINDDTHRMRVHELQEKQGWPAQYSTHAYWYSLQTVHYELHTSVIMMLGLQLLKIMLLKEKMNNVPIKIKSYWQNVCIYPQRHIKKIFWGVIRKIISTELNHNCIMTQN